MANLKENASTTNKAYLNSLSQRVRGDKFAFAAGMILVLIVGSLVAWASKGMLPAFIENRKHDSAISIANKAKEQGDYSKAVEQAVLVVEQAKSTDKKLQSYRIAENAYAQIGEYDKILELAIKVEEQTTEDDEKRPIVLANLAAAQYGSLKISDAIKSMEELITLYGDKNFQFPYSKEQAEQILIKYRDEHNRQGDGGFDVLGPFNPPKRGQ